MATAPKQPLPVSVRGFESRHVIKFLWALIPFVALAGMVFVIGEQAVPAFVGLLIVGALLLITLALLAWAYWLVHRTFPVALTEEGVLVDHPSGRFEVAWPEVIGAVQEYYVARYTHGFLLTLKFRRAGEEQALQLGFMRATKALMTFSGLFGKVRITAGYGEAVAYLRAKGVNADPSQEYAKLAEEFAKAKARGRVKVVRQ